MQTLPIESLDIRQQERKSSKREHEHKVSVATLKEYNQSFSDFYKPKSNARFQTLQEYNSNGVYLPQSGFSSANHHNKQISKKLI